MMYDMRYDIWCLMWYVYDMMCRCDTMYVIWYDMYDVIWCMICDIWYVVWYMMYDVKYDIWCMVWSIMYDVIWCICMIWCDICYDMYDMIWCMLWYVRYDIMYDMYYMIWCILGRNYVVWYLLLWISIVFYSRNK